MRGKIIEVNYTRGLAIFEDESGDYGYFEMLGEDDIEKDDVILGNLHSLGSEIITKVETNEKYDVFIEDWGMSLKIALESIY
ncbi:MAG: hypothetical protein J1G06_01585 [Oscillospiraceae bacterium]|nr:hypothetical protein [Oscillospiraceae bacterium]